MPYNVGKKTKIDLPEELLCAYVDGTTTPDEDREMMAMLASDRQLAQLHDDLREVMDIINMDEDNDPMEWFLAEQFAPASAEPMLCCEDEVEGEQAFDVDFGECQSVEPNEDIVSFEENIMRVTPDEVTSLDANEIFVFGSNPWGLHNGGTSKLAKTLFGAKQGVGEGRQGQTYAIPTIVGGVQNVKQHVDRFLDYAAKHPKLHFLVTPVGCGTAGFTPIDIAPLFVRAKDMPNISLPQAFWDVIE